MVEKLTDLKLKILSLYRGNYLAAYHVREMARLLGASHAALLPHINSLEKEGVIVAGKSGKSKPFTLNMENISVKDYLIMAEEYEKLALLERAPVIKKLSEKLSGSGASGAAILFGSYAKGSFTDESDIDIEYLDDILGVKLINKLKEIGSIYGKKVSARAAAPDEFEKSLRKMDALAIEIVHGHVVLQNADLFVSILWRYFNGIRQAVVYKKEEWNQAVRAKRGHGESIPKKSRQRIEHA
ncbi:MAG: nucleotidyltransferase domain-containing protein [Nanoarchaeota archaeon]|nr:nucleotidyltransferase domain-containing protein [Nanoarchaeota archaeon]